jgi:hypothetical protein
MARMPKRSAKESVVDTRAVDASTTLKLKLAPGGGAAIRMIPAD